MPGTTVMKKPGYMGRACIAWAALNAAMFVTLAVTVYFLNPWLSAWYVILPVVVATIGTEWAITEETIAPIIKDWIVQEEVVKDGEKPSWDKSPAKTSKYNPQVLNEVGV